jgi:carboxyl-terminal processing protease
VLLKEKELYAMTNKMRVIIAIALVLGTCLAAGAESAKPAAATRPYGFNTDVKLTLEKNSEIHLTCPPNRHDITEYVLYYRAPTDGEELAGVRAVFTDGRCTECGIRREAWEGILQQARYTACLGIVKWQLRDGRLEVDFCATDDLERCHREYRQYRLEGKRYRAQYQDGRLVCPVELPETQRLAGFARFWSEVKFNFPFFEKVPEVNWDQVLVDYLPQVQQAKTDVEYYRVLRRCVALLKDNHTSVWGPTDEAPCRPPVEIRPVEGKAVVARVCPADSIKDAGRNAELLAAALKPGEEITHIDGRPVPRILAEDIYPYIAASTPQGLDLDAYPRLAKGENGTQTTLRIRDLRGKERDVSLTRGYYDFRKEKGPFLRELKDGVVLVRLDSFGSNWGVKQFEGAFDKVLGAKGLVLDVRDNGGGNSAFGDAILSMLIDRPIKGFRWKTRQYLPMFRATEKAELWFEGSPGTVEPSAGRHYQGPVVVLTGPATGSAAEDFVVVFQASGRGKVVGQRTNGSTGQIMTFDLPGGGGFRVCTKWCSYPDGREFVGIGVIPDVEVAPTRQDIADGRDAVLEMALHVLGTQKP